MRARGARRHTRTTIAGASTARTFTRGEATLVWDSIGTPGTSRGLVFVLVHGLGLGRVEFDGLAPLLATHGTVICVDLPGFGDAPPPARVGSIEDSAQLLLELLDELGVSRAVLVGHSMGSQVVAEASIRRPAIVRALVLIAPVVDPAATTTAMLARRMVHDLYDEGPKVLFTGLWLYARAGILIYLRKLRMMLAYATSPTLARVSAPVLIVRGERDVVAPKSWCEDAAALTPNGSLVEISGRGHETFLNDPVPTATAIAEFVHTHAG